MKIISRQLDHGITQMEIQMRELYGSATGTMESAVTRRVKSGNRNIG